MKIAIHDTPGGFSDQWFAYCRDHGVEAKRVNCLDSDIVAQVADCDGLMWHWPHWDYRATPVSRQVIMALEQAGKKVFPDSRTCWHYDDKIGQKYLLEALGAPLVPCRVFYDRSAALTWAERAGFPQVFKLRRGAGSANVRLVRSTRQAKRLIRRAFGGGYPPVNRPGLMRDRVWHLRRDRDLAALLGLAKGLARLAVPTSLERHSPREKGYVYFQDFVAGNTHDIRIVVIGKRAFGIKRMVRAHDFRASGSGVIRHAKGEVDLACVRRSFELSGRIGSQCLAYDYVFMAGEPKLLEISYAFSQGGYGACPGYWDDGLDWHEGPFVPEWFMISDFIESLGGGHGRAV